MTEVYLSRRWWFSPLMFTIALIAAVAILCKVSETAREVLAKAVMLVVGAMATPFILETTVAIIGLVIVIAVNQRRLQKEGDGWVYLAQTEADAASVAEGAETPEKRLEGVILQEPPSGKMDLDARLAMAEGFLELGLKAEALEHLKMLSADEQKDTRVAALKIQASV